MNKKRAQTTILLLLILFLLGSGIIFYQQRKPSTSITNSSNTAPAVKNELNMILEGYPTEIVPFYEMKMISSMKFMVDRNPQNYAGYLGKNTNYYNVVFKTTADATSTLDYYRSLMSEVSAEDSNDEQVVGKIGKYKVSASHYGDNPDNYAYLQVHLPVEEYSAINPFFSTYPELFVIDEQLTEYYSSYGILNQKGGEIEYAQWFAPNRDELSIAELARVYQQHHQTETNFSFDPDSGAMKWQKDEWQINISFSTDHGRVYTMLRKPAL
jgi:hypothetical protein